VTKNAKLTPRQRAMLRFLDVVGRPYEHVKPGQVAMLRSMEERGLVDRGSIVHPRPRWSLTPAGRAALQLDANARLSSEASARTETLDEPPTPSSTGGKG
jgi:hypothetical protein